MHISNGPTRSKLTVKTLRDTESYRILREVCVCVCVCVCMYVWMCRAIGTLFFVCSHPPSPPPPPVIKKNHKQPCAHS